MLAFFKAQESRENDLVGVRAQLSQGVIPAFFTRDSRENGDHGFLVLKMRLALIFTRWVTLSGKHARLFFRVLASVGATWKSRETVQS